MSNYEAVGQSRLTPNSTVPNNTPVRRQRPGVVIFLHGVNDPGASYASVEDGLCQGLNERLDRADLRPGRYGVDYRASARKPESERTQDDIDALDDPDTHLYMRKDKYAKSVMIPFYWGYRAADNEIKREPNGDPTKIRTQYQDKRGNRLDRHFGKAGGFFANATNNLVEMYGEGFDKFIRHVANPTLPNSQHMATGPHRRYFVLAAERLATLVSTIRGLYPSETITIIGHSQGTLITLLAQALLADRSQRCADCVIMVASPYSILTGPTPSGHNTLSTLLRIVEHVTKNPYAMPALGDISEGQPNAGGRAGARWNPRQGHRIGKGSETIVFPERDNRGKVYLYFSPDDSTVGLDTVVGIGTFGVPDTANGSPAMEKLREMRFFQRLWTKRHRGGKPVLVGAEPCRQLLRAEGEPRHAAGWSLKSTAAEPMSKTESLWTNGEALVPSHVPQMFGGEAVKGSPTTLGKDRPDDVTQNIALGKESANFPWIPLPDTYAGMNSDAARAKFNSASPDENKHTASVRLTSLIHRTMEREMTPEEAREWMWNTKSKWEDNSYHSAILRDPENHRWVTAMDVAIGQGFSLDDRDWRQLLTLMADWKMGREQLKAMQNNPKWQELSESTRKLIVASARYYRRGEFPAADLVDLKTLPQLVTGIIFGGSNL
ncbi:MAG: T6SS effector phospholipase Tle3 domain-containing protein [Stenotrophomonas sp.]|uniref:T6SS effector phospholipase Tle3 domain-containing protein n=1 Tax=Stenotrophomonas sp. TaxID=69392 RepID=UPI003D6D535E